MKSSEIKINTPYRAKVDWYGQYKVTVLEKDQLNPRQRRARGRAIAKSGIRIRMEEEVIRFGSVEQAKGSELVIPSRDIIAEWTDEDDQAQVEAAELKAWQDEITRRLREAGYAPFERDYTLEGWVDTGDFDLRGEELYLSRKLTEELLEMAGL